MNDYIQAALIILVIIIVAFVGVVVHNAYSETEQQCTLYSSEFLIHLATFEFAGCDWVVEKVKANSSEQWRTDFDYASFVSGGGYDTKVVEVITMEKIE